jgi:hypothetical protein
MIGAATVELGKGVLIEEANMKLRDFIADALMEVHHGVQNAIKRRDEEGLAGRISPGINEPDTGQIDWTKMVRDVEFDVAVTVAYTKEKSGEAGLEIFSFGKAGAKGAAKSEESTVNRIKFSIPVIIPVQPIQNR